MATKTKKQRITWGEWYRGVDGETPERERAMDAGVASEVSRRPAFTSGSGESQVQATAISYDAKAWPVMQDEFRDGTDSDGVGGFQDVREVRVGWIVCVTRTSRWQGEGVSQEWTYHPGECPDLSRLFDCRFSDAVESRTWVIPVEFWRVRRYLQPE